MKVDDKGLAVRKEDVEPETPVVCDCPRLDREDWDGVESDWSDIIFAKTTTSAVMGVPVGYDSSRDDLRKRAENAGATVPDDAMLLNGAGKFRRPIMLEVEGVAPGTKGFERPGGIAFTKIHEAKWGQLNRAAGFTKLEARSKYGRDPDNLWVWYLTCRVCSQERNFETLIVAHYRQKP